MRSTQSRPLRGAKNRNQASSSASADFLLEAEKRGSPPKSEKAAAFWRVGGAGWGVQPFLREKSSKNNGSGFAESHNDGFNITGKSLCDTNSIAVMGFIDVLKKAKFFLDLRKKCLNLALTADKILLMDSSSFNIPLAKRIKKRDKTKQIIYYILPQVWAWKPWRAKAIEANCDRLAAILPFEVGFYREKAEFVGHPLLDEIKAFRVGNSPLDLHSADLVNFGEQQTASLVVSPKFTKNHESQTENPSVVDSALNAQNLGENSAQIAESSNIFSFMPGSRTSEIKRIFPIFTEVKDALKSRDKDAKFHLIIPQKFASQNLAQIYGDVSDFHISFDAHRSLFQSRFAFICSGTATLECALIGTPFVLGYKCRALEAFVARCFLNVKFIGLANILYEKISPNKTFHTELIQGDLSAQNLLNALDSANENDFLQKSLALRKYLKCGSASAVAKMLYGL